MKYTHIPLWFATAFFSFFTSSSHANCNFFGSGLTPPSGGDTYYIYRETQILENGLRNPNTVLEGRPMGYVRVQISAGISGQAGYYCPSAGLVYLKMHPSFITSEIRDRYGAYPSRIPGLGILSMTINGVSFPGSAIQQFTGFRPSVITAEIQFLKTGPLQSVGDILSGPFAYEVRDTPNQILFEYRFSGDSTIPIPVKPTCNLQPIPAVSLGTHPISGFTVANPTTASQDFTLELACSGGTQGTSLNATMTLTDNTNMANITDALSLSTNHVRGVGVQILRNGTPLLLGPLNGPNSHNLGTITPQPGGAAFNYSIRLQARYKQTGSSVSGAGQANAEAIVTINYQ